MALPDKVDYLIIGAGIHGLSTAWHLAEKLKAKGKGDGSKILVVDKDSIAAGASGVACGVVRNNYYQPAMRELMAMCVDVWESDQKNFHYHNVGYMQISPKCMEEDVASIYAQQKNIGYDSVFIQGEKESNDYMKKMFSDWQAKGITSVLHEKKGGYANNTSAIYGLADKAESEGVRILTGTEVKGFQYTMACFGILSVICFYICYKMTQERVRPQKESASVSICLLLVAVSVIPALICARVSTASSVVCLVSYVPVAKLVAPVRISPTVNTPVMLIRYKYLVVASHFATSPVFADVPPVTVSPTWKVPDTAGLDASSNVRTKDCFLSISSISSMPVSIFSSEYAKSSQTRSNV